MSKTIQNMLQEAKSKWDLWTGIADEPQALLDRNKTREEALQLANYFEGKFDGLCDARGLERES